MIYSCNININSTKSLRNLINAWSEHKSFDAAIYSRGEQLRRSAPATYHFLISSCLTKILIRANFTGAVYGLGDRVKRTLDKKRSLSTDG